MKKYTVIVYTPATATANIIDVISAKSLTEARKTAVNYLSTIELGIQQLVIASPEQYEREWRSKVEG